MTNENNNKNKTDWMQQTDQLLQHKTPMIIKQPQNNNNEKNHKQFHTTKRLPPPGPPPPAKKKDTVEMMYNWTNIIKMHDKWGWNLCKTETKNIN